MPTSAYRLVGDVRTERRESLHASRFAESLHVLGSLLTAPFTPSLRALDRSEIENYLHASGRLPAQEPLSRQYHSLINEVATGLGIKRVATHEDLFAVVETIEKRRQKLCDAVEQQAVLLPSETTRRLRRLDPGERAWLEYVALNVSTPLQAIFDRQSLHGAPQERFLTYLEDAHPASARVFRRLRATNLPNLRPAYVPKDVPDRARYSCSVPWFPDKPNYSGMWPKDLTARELRFFRRHFSKGHPVLQPYTVVERFTPEHARRIAKEGRLQNTNGEYVEWIVKGLDGRRYRVVNMIAHEDYRGHFMEIAHELRESVRVSERKGRLHPSFKRYVLTVARAIERGDFASWLRADMAQTEGNLFFTFFPHEGYWDDNLKFPLTFETGIRDLQAAKYIARNAEVLAEQEKDVVEAGRRLGVRKMTPPFSASDIATMVQVVWIYQKGAFMAAFPQAEVAGHDYPKVFYPGVDGHRNIVFADVTTANAKATRKIADALFPQHFAKYVNSRGFTRFAMWHEATHWRVGNRVDTLMRDGRELGEVFGDQWGVFAEPGGDFGAFKTAILQYRRGTITRDEFMEIIAYGLHRAVFQLPTKAQALDPAFLGNWHAVGRTLLVGYLFSREAPAIKINAKGKIVDIDVDELVAGLEELDRKFTDVGLAGNLKSYLQFYRKCARALPDRFMDHTLALVGKLNRMYLVDRPGDRIAGVSWAA